MGQAAEHYRRGVFDLEFVRSGSRTAVGRQKDRNLQRDGREEVVRFAERQHGRREHFEGRLGPLAHGHVFDHPHHRREAVQHHRAHGDDRVEAAVEELMRFRSAAPAVARRTSVPLDLGDAVVEAGCPVMLSLWGADSDPAAYAAPDEIDPVANAGVPHLGFGHGPHHCLGAALARVELQEALRALTAQLEPPTLRAAITWDVPIGINGPTDLPLRVVPRPS